MKAFKPKVSIIIPVYNGANYMRKAIDSALSQTYENLEVVVVNDGSRDHGATDEIARSYGDRIRYYAKENGGVASALNYAIEKMTGEYISWLSHDDMYAPTKVEKQVAALAECEDPHTIIACNVTVIDENDQKIKSNRIHSRVKRSMRCFLATDTDTGLNGCTLLLSKELFSKAGGFDPNLKATQDYDLWFRLTYHTHFVILEDELVLSRSHEMQSSRSMGMLPTLEADNLHAKMLSKIETTEMRLFIGDDLKYLTNAYQIYRNAAYLKTAARLYAMILRIAIEMGETNRASVLLSERLFSDEQKKAGKIITRISSILTARLSSAKSSKPTILVYCNVWVKGGIERVMSVVFEELSDKYNFILVSHTPVDYLEGFPLPEAVCHIEIRPDLAPEIAYVLLMLADLSQASLLISNPNIITEVLDIYPVMKACGIKTIACNHYYYFLPTWASWLYPAMVKRLDCLKEASVATWLNTFNANAYAMHNSNGALMPNPNTFGQVEINELLRSNNVVLCVGRFYDSIKRLDRALKVFKHVLALKPDARLVLVGDYKLNMRIPSSSTETIIELLDRLDFPEGAVVFAGEQPSMTEYYQQSAVLIMTSDYEGFSLVLVEAGSHGVPAVIFNTPGLEDVISEGVNGFVVEQDDLKGMAEKVADLLSNPQRRASMGEHAIELSKRFDRKVICKRWESLIDTVLSVDAGPALEQQLKRFIDAPVHPEAFIQTLIQEYEKGLQRMASQPVVERTVFVTPPPPQPAPQVDPQAAVALQSADSSLQIAYQSLQTEHQALQAAHSQLLFYYQDLVNSRAVRYITKIKETLKKFKNRRPAAG